MTSAAVLGAVVFWTTSAALKAQATSRIEAEIAGLRAEYATGGLKELVADVALRGRGSAALDYLVQDANGTKLAGELPPVGARRGWMRLFSHEAEDRDRPEAVRALAVDLPGGAVLAVGDDLGRTLDAEEAILTAFAWAVGATVLLGVGGGIWLSHLFLRRVDAISGTAEAIIGGDLARRVPLQGTGDDLDRLAETLNHMLDRIVALMDSVRQVSSDIAHDLRTPLSRLCQRLEEARLHAQTVDAYRAATDAAAGEAEGLLGTFAALLRIAQVEAGAQRAAFRRVELSAMAELVADAFAPAAEDAGYALSSVIVPGLWLDGDRELLTQMLVNLVENALRHTPPGTRITIRVSAMTGEVRLAVEDTGPGIPEAERPRVVQRFYRREQSRTTPGSGLGLSLVAAVAELHGAKLRLEDAGPGLRVVVDFPSPY